MVTLVLKGALFKVVFNFSFLVQNLIVKYLVFVQPSPELNPQITKSYA